MTTKKLPRKPLEVTLYDANSRFVTAEITRGGSLLVSGQDVAKEFEDIWGDSDYEYWLKVSRKDKEKVLQALVERCNEKGISTTSLPTNKNRAILDLLSVLFGRRYVVFDKIQSFFKRKGIPAKFSNYL